MNQFWTFQCIFLKNFKDFLEAYSLSKIYKIVLEYTLKSSQLISSSDNKKILLTTKNVRLDSGHYATKYHFFTGHFGETWLIYYDKLWLADTARYNPKGDDFLVLRGTVEELFAYILGIYI